MSVHVNARGSTVLPGGADDITARHNLAGRFRYVRPGPIGSVSGARRTTLGQERAKSRFNEARGKVEEDFGRTVGDRATERSGKLDQVKDSIQEKMGQAELDTRRFADGLRVR